MAMVFLLTLFFLLKSAVSSKPECFMETLSILETALLGRFFSGPEGVNILSLILISWKLWESLIFVSYWNKNKFQSLEMFSKMELLFSSQPYSVCFSFYVLAVLIFRAFGFQAYLHFYGSLITNTSSYLIILLAFFFKLHFFQTN